MSGIDISGALLVIAGLAMGCAGEEPIPEEYGFPSESSPLDSYLNASDGTDNATNLDDLTTSEGTQDVIVPQDGADAERLPPDQGVPADTDTTNGQEDINVDASEPADGDNLDREVGTNVFDGADLDTGFEEDSSNHDVMDSFELAPDIDADAGDSECFLRGQPSDWPSFTDVAAELGFHEHFGQSRGVSATDFDDDGDIDLFLTNYKNLPHLYINQGDGSFREQLNRPTTGFDWGSASADYDNDGDSDLFMPCGGFVSHPCANRLFRNDGVSPSGEILFVDVSADSGIGGPIYANVGGAWADYDLDGDLDLYVASSYRFVEGDPPFGLAPHLLYQNQGDGTFVELAEEVGASTNTGNSRQAAWLDYDGDGYPDVYVPSRRGRNILFRNLGDGTFDDVTDDVLSEPRPAFGAVAEDFNNDGHVDLLVSARTRRLEGEDLEDVIVLHGFFINDGAGWFVDESVGSGLNLPSNSSGGIPAMGLLAGDIDLDGFPEVMFGNGGPSQGNVNSLGSFVISEEGGLVWIDRTDSVDFPAPEDGREEAYPPYPYRTHGMAFFDYDNDGDVDVFVGNGGAGNFEPPRLFRNDGTNNPHWIKIRLEGTTSPRDGTGARVRVSDGPEGDSNWAVYRQAYQAAGFNNSHPRTLHIGMGACRGPYHVTISWPGGEDQEVAGIEARTRNTIRQAE